MMDDFFAAVFLPVPRKLIGIYPEFAESIMTRDHAAVLWKRWRLLEDRELYDLEQDPRETHNLYRERPEIVRELKQLLDTTLKSGRSRPSE